MQVSAGGDHTHNHGLLAGISARAAGVLALLVLMLLAWHRVGQAFGTAATVILWALAALVVAYVASEIAVRFLRLRHHVLHPETLVPQTVRAEIIPAQGAPAITGVPVPAPAIEAPRREIHYHFNTAEAVWAARRVMGTTDPSEAEGLPR